jgi:hypothetical protein
MWALQILLLAASFASLVGCIVIGNAIAKDVNGSLGTGYNGIWRLNGNKIWNEHERLFPASRKRAALATTVVAAFGLITVAAFLPR